MKNLLAATLLCCSAWSAPAQTGSSDDPADHYQPSYSPPRSEPSQAASNSAASMVIAALNFLGLRYRAGGNTPQEGFDCSGFTRHLFHQNRGIVLPRRAEEQAHATALMPVQRRELQPGDLVFFNTLQRTFSHVGIYIGEGKFIHAPRTGASVRIEHMGLAYWAKRYTGARRLRLDPAQF
jgi:cell wall-associated NlpC family hydrolase